jgi:hypothetical protein
MCAAIFWITEQNKNKAKRKTTTTEKAGEERNKKKKNVFLPLHPAIIA